MAAFGRIVVILVLLTIKYPNWGKMDKERICEALVNANVVRFGDFTLVSGQKSPIYIDLRVLPSYPKSFDAISGEMAKLIKDLNPDLVAGIESAGIPLATAVALKNKAPMIYIRKKPKDYGTKSRIEGLLRENEKVVLIDDLITDGGSKVKSLEAIREVGARIEDIVVVLDREQGGEDTMLQHKCRLHAMVTLKDLLAYMEKKNFISHEQYARVLSYIEG